MSAPVDVLAVMTPGPGKVIPSDGWFLDRSLGNGNLYTAKIACRGTPRATALVDADALSEARAAVADAFKQIEEGKRQWDRVAKALGADGDDVDDVFRKAAVVAELVKAMQHIKTRATPVSGDTDQERKRDLYHIEAIAKRALANMGGLRMSTPDVRVVRVVRRYYWPHWIARDCLRNQYGFRRGRTWYGLPWADVIVGFRYVIEEPVE